MTRFDVLAANWILGKPAAFDFTITSVTAKSNYLKQVWQQGLQPLPLRRGSINLTTGSVQSWVGSQFQLWLRCMAAGVQWPRGWDVWLLGYSGQVVETYGYYLRDTPTTTNLAQTYHSNIRSSDPMSTGKHEKVRTSAVVPVKHNTCMYTIIKNGTGIWHQCPLQRDL